MRKTKANGTKSLKFSQTRVTICYDRDDVLRTPRQHVRVCVVIFPLLVFDEHVVLDQTLRPVRRDVGSTQSSARVIVDGTEAPKRILKSRPIHATVQHLGRLDTGGIIVLITTPTACRSKRPTKDFPESGAYFFLVSTKQDTEHILRISSALCAYGRLWNKGLDMVAVLSCFLFYVFIALWVLISAWHTKKPTSNGKHPTCITRDTHGGRGFPSRFQKGTHYDEQRHSFRARARLPMMTKKKAPIFFFPSYEAVTWSSS